MDLLRPITESTKKGVPDNVGLAQDLCFCRAVYCRVGYCVILYFNAQCIEERLHCSNLRHLVKHHLSQLRIVLTMIA
jgi:hypothetical protein